MSKKKSKDEKGKLPKADNNIAEEFAKAMQEQISEDKIEAEKYKNLDKTKRRI